MSWNFSMCIDAGGNEERHLANMRRNYTYNVAPMFHEAFGVKYGSRELNGQL